MIIRVLGLSCLAAAVAAPAAAETLRIAYVERAPYYYTEDGQAKGSILDATRRIAEKAGIELKLASVPSKRILDELANDVAPFCSVNWKKNADREKIGKFSVPAFPGQQMVAVVRKDREVDFKKHATLAAVTQDAALKLGAVDGWTLGPYIDGLMAAMPQGALDKATLTPAQNVKKVSVGRIAYTLVEQGEAEYAIRNSGEDPAGLTTVAYSDIPVQAPAYFWCSRSVGDDTIARINDAIAALYPDIAKP